MSVRGVLLLLLALLGTTLLGVVHAVEVEILEADKLEVRPITLPGGGETELTVITGSPLRLRVDGDDIIAEYAEFDRESRILRIVGPGNVSYDNVATKGEDYLLDLSSGELNFQDVFIFTEPLDIEGVSAVRQPGQIDISGGLFSPCSRCRPEVQDYRFSAERMTLYPGDRLVAFNVTVYLRDLPSFFLPLLVVPLGPEERRPRFNLTRGSTTERASIALDWPYVFGANAFGVTSLRYYADVTSGLSNSPAETILGGTVQESYFGGGFNHRFYTGRGRGDVRFFYTPSFLSEFETERTPADYEYTFSYSTEEALNGLQTDLLLERDDPTNERIINLSARLSDTYGGFNFDYVTQTYFDLELTDSSFSPSYDDDEGALRTYGQIEISPEDDLSFSVGPFTLTNLLVSAGVYEDYANSNNASARASGLTLGGSPIIRGGRLLEQHTVTLETLSPFAGSSLSGETRYTGQLYTTTNPSGEFERLVDWTTTLSADQTFAGGSFGLAFSRVILEGESPFAFDARSTPNSRTDLRADLRLEPLPWFELSVSETYVFGDSDELNPSESRAEPLETRAELFNNVDWLDITLEQAYDLQENDPGLLGATVGVTSPNTRLTSSLEVSGVYDLKRTGDPITGEGSINESEVDVGASLGYSEYASLEVALGYDFNGTLDPFAGGFGDPYRDPFDDDELGDDADNGQELYKPLLLSVTAGSETQEDSVPSVTLEFDRDLNRNRMNAVGYEVSGRVGPLELSASQDFDFDTRDASDTLFSVTYPDIVQLSASGFTLLPPEVIGLALDPEDSATYQLELLDQTQQDTVRLYELTYETTYGPLNGFDLTDGLGFNDTSLTGRVNLETTFFETPLGPLGFGVEFDTTLEIADDAQPLTYLSNGSSTLTTDFFSRVGLQGTLDYSAQADEFGLFDQTLEFTDFGPTIKFWDDLYVSVIFDDTWDFIDPDSTATPYNFQPEIFVTLDRCCWALYGSLDTETGGVSLTLGYPGSDQGLTGFFESPLKLPRREEP